MALLEVKKFGCPILRKKGQDVGSVTEELQRLVEDMFETMYEEEGIGLAAQQVGVAKRIVVLDVGPHDPSIRPLVLIDPEIVWSVGEIVGEEGCLSFPGITGDVKRSAHVRVRALDKEGKSYEIDLREMAARVVQHEIDHLDGILVVDHFSVIRRNLLRGQLRRLKREGSRQGTGLTIAGEVA